MSDSTRQRRSDLLSENSPSSITPSEAAAYQPPRRTTSPMRHVKPPLSEMRLGTLIYILMGLTTLLMAYYGYRTVQHSAKNIKAYTQANKNGDADASRTFSKHPKDPVESHLSALAKLLGIPTHKLASAVLHAVPTESLSHLDLSPDNILLQEKEKTQAPTNIRDDEDLLQEE